MQVSEKLKGCALWRGSTLEIADQLRYLTRGMLIDKRDALRKVLDRKPNEEEFLRELEKEISTPIWPSDPSPSRE